MTEADKTISALNAETEPQDAAREPRAEALNAAAEYIAQRYYYDDPELGRSDEEYLPLAALLDAFAAQEVAIERPVIFQEGWGAAVKMMRATEAGFDEDGRPLAAPLRHPIAESTEPGHPGGRLLGHRPIPAAERAKPAASDLRERARRLVRDTRNIWTGQHAEDEVFAALAEARREGEIAMRERAAQVAEQDDWSDVYGWSPIALHIAATVRTLEPS